MARKNQKDSEFFAHFTDAPVLPDDISNLRPLHFHTTVVDRLSGATFVERIWGPESNLRVVQQRAVDPAVREACYNFFLSRKLRVMMNNIISVKSFKIGAKMFQVDTVYKELVANTSNIDAAAVIAEIIFPVLHNIGMISDSRVYTTRVRFPIAPVTASLIARDVMMEEIVRVARASTARLNAAKDETFHTDGFACAFAEAFVPVGAKILETNELGAVIDDIVSGVRAHIDPELSGLTGSIPTSWSQNATVAELASCFPFVMAALAVPSGSSLRIKNELSQLLDWAPIVLASMKSSERYAIVGREAFAYDICKQALLDLRGLPRMFVMHRSAQPVAVAQAVYVMSDAFIADAHNIFESKTRLDQQIAAGYSNVSNMGTDHAVSELKRGLRHLIEAGFSPDRLGYVFDVGSGYEISSYELACLTASRVQANFKAIANSGKPALDTSSPHQPFWVFYMNTPYRDAPIALSGKFLGEEYMTNSVAEALLMSHDIMAKGSMNARPQLIAKAAYGSAMINFDAAHETVPVVNKVSYNATIGHVHIHGKLAINAIGSLAAPDSMTVVKPVFNSDIFDTVADVYASFDEAVDAYSKEAQRLSSTAVDARVLAYIQRIRAQLVQSIAQSVSISLRQQIADAIREQAVASLSPQKALEMNAQLAQAHFAAYTDLVGLAFFLEAQGVDHSFVDDVFSSQELMTEVLTNGSDRTQAQRI